MREFNLLSVCDERDEFCSLLCFFFSSHSLHTKHRFDHYELLFCVFICLHLKNDRIASLFLLLLLLLVVFFV